MGSFKEHQKNTKNKIFAYTICAFLPLALVRLYFYPLILPFSPNNQISSNNYPISITKSSSSSPSIEKEKPHVEEKPCDYTNGKWVHDKQGPLYNGTNCETIKEGQNCMGHGRPDTGYLHWKWRPNGCKVSRFESLLFLQLLRNKHVAFVGDSLARNQLESLLCMVAASSSLPQLVYSNGEDNKFRRWIVPSHNVTVSIYWSPFLVKGIEKANDANGPNYNQLFLDDVDEKWASDIGTMDMVVLSVGHWFLHPAVFHDRDSVIGCHFCTGQNYTEIGFYSVFGKAIKTTLKAIMERRGGTSSKGGINVILTTFSPAHFEGEWDKLGACSKTEPYKDGEMELVDMNAEMRKAEMDEVVLAKENGKRYKNFRLEALDVTKMALMRPDGHPGPYMHPYPFANGVPERVQNDCVHWCLPGPIDAWNEILLDVMKRWGRGSSEMNV